MTFVWLPAVKVEFVNVVWPPASVAEPSVLVPSLKVTVPVGVPAPGATAPTVAVKIIGWPNTDGFGEETSVVELLALVTVWTRFGEVLVLKLVSLL